MICRAISPAGACRYAAGPSVAARNAGSAALAGSPDDSPDSYNGDDARRFHHGWYVAIDRYFEATKQNRQLEFALEAFQVTFSAAEVEANVIWAQLAESDARVIGKFFVILVSLLLLSHGSSNDLLSFSLALTAQLEVLQVAVGDAAGALNALGNTLEARLQDVPVRAREVAFHGVRRGAAVALAIA